jgi:putative DNA primase/helicase
MSAFLSLRQIAHRLSGEVVGGEVLAPGPGHSPRDRSLSVCISATAPDGFLAFSHAGDDWRACRDYVRERLGIEPDDWMQKAAPARTEARRRPPEPAGDHDDDPAERRAAALALWCESVDPRATVAEIYLRSRSLELGDDLPGKTLRFHPDLNTMIALFRNIETGRPQAISRTFLAGDARKIGRRFLALL